VAAHATRDEAPSGTQAGSVHDTQVSKALSEPREQNAALRGLSGERPPNVEPQKRIGEQPRLGELRAQPPDESRLGSVLRNESSLSFVLRETVAPHLRLSPRDSGEQLPSSRQPPFFEQR
jgi:hypothetical protein